MRRINKEELVEEKEKHKGVKFIADKRTVMEVRLVEEKQITQEGVMTYQ